MFWCCSKLEHFITAQITAKKNTNDKNNKIETMLLSPQGAMLSCVAVELVFCIFSPLYILVLFCFSRVMVVT